LCRPKASIDPVELWRSLEFKSSSGFAEKCLQLVTAASPPDVRRGYASPLSFTDALGLRPWFGPLAHKLRAKPERGAQPIWNPEINGEAKPRLTSGGEAATKQQHDFSGR
jgi:hypothetical protein